MVTSKDNFPDLKDFPGEVLDVTFYAPEPKPSLFNMFRSTTQTIGGDKGKFAKAVDGWSAHNGIIGIRLVDNDGEHKVLIAADTPENRTGLKASSLLPSGPVWEEKKLTVPFSEGALPAQQEHKDELEKFKKIMATEKASVSNDAIKAKPLKM